MANNYSNIGPVTHISVGSVLSRTFSTILNYPLVFLLPFIIETLQQVFFEVFSSEFNIISLIVEMFLTSLSQGVIIYAVYQVLLGNRASIGRSVLHGLARILTLCYLHLVKMLFFFLSMLAVMIPSVIISRIIDFQIPSNIPLDPLLDIVPQELMPAVSIAFIPCLLIALFLSVK